MKGLRSVIQAIKSLQQRNTGLSKETPLQAGKLEELAQLRICFSIPASPTDAFYSQVAMFRLALDSFGGIYKKAHIILSLGNETIEPISNRWLDHLGVNTMLYWTDTSLFLDIGQLAQGNNRWNHNYDNYDLIIFSDADTILIKPINELLLQVMKKNLVAGVIAHYPFPHDKNESPNELWHNYAKRFIGKDISLNFRYTLLNSQDEDSSCPFYVNFGFVVMTPQTLNTIRKSFLNIRSSIIPFLKNPRFSGQIALTLAIHKHEIPVMSAPMIYNFPNDPIADKLYSNQLKSIAIIHYLRTNKFDRQKIFTSEKNFRRFLSLRLKGSNKFFQKFIREITYDQYPFK